MEIFDQQEGLVQYAGPGGWNDPDLLMVGLYGKGKSSSVNGRFKGCTFMEYRTNFALWCMLAAPLILNSDLRNIDKETLQLLTNSNLLNINQDKLGKQAATILNKQGIQVLKKELSGGNVAICLFNRSDKPVVISFDVKKEFDLWAPFKSVMNIFESKFEKDRNKLSVSLAAHDCRVYRFVR